MATIEELEERLNTFEASLLQMAKNNEPIVAKVDDTSNKVTQITPYTETKTAYYGETEKTFYDVPQGILSVYFSNYNSDYSVVRVCDRLTVTFYALTEQTDITISIQ